MAADNELLKILKDIQAGGGAQPLAQRGVTGYQSSNQRGALNEVDKSLAKIQERQNDILATEGKQKLLDEERLKLQEESLRLQKKQQNLVSAYQKGQFSDKKKLEKEMRAAKMALTANIESQKALNSNMSAQRKILEDNRKVIQDTTKDLEKQINTYGKLAKSGSLKEALGESSIAKKFAAYKEARSEGASVGQAVGAAASMNPWVIAAKGLKMLAEEGADAGNDLVRIAAKYQVAVNKIPVSTEEAFLVAGQRAKQFATIYNDNIMELMRYGFNPDEVKAMTDALTLTIRPTKNLESEMTTLTSAVAKYGAEMGVATEDALSSAESMYKNLGYNADQQKRAFETIANVVTASNEDMAGSYEGVTSRADVWNDLIWKQARDSNAWVFSHEAMSAMLARLDKQTAKLNLTTAQRIKLEKGLVSFSSGEGGSDAFKKLAGGRFMDDLDKSLGDTDLKDAEAVYKKLLEKGFVDEGDKDKSATIARNLSKFRAEGSQNKELWGENMMDKNVSTAAMRARFTTAREDFLKNIPETVGKLAVARANLGGMEDMSGVEQIEWIEQLGSEVDIDTVVKESKERAKKLEEEKAKEAAERAKDGVDTNPYKSGAQAFAAMGGGKFFTGQMINLGVSVFEAKKLQVLGPLVVEGLIQIGGKSARTSQNEIRKNVKDMNAEESAAVDNVRRSEVSFLKSMLDPLYLGEARNVEDLINSDRFATADEGTKALYMRKFVDEDASDPDEQARQLAKAFTARAQKSYEDRIVSNPDYTDERKSELLARSGMTDEAIREAVARTESRVEENRSVMPEQQNFSSAGASPHVVVDLDKKTFSLTNVPMTLTNGPEFVAESIQEQATYQSTVPGS